MPPFTTGRVAQIHGTGHSLFFGVVAASDKIPRVFVPTTEWTVAALGLGGGLRVKTLMCPAAVVSPSSLGLPPVGSPHRLYMQCFMAAHNALESITNGSAPPWPFPGVPRPRKPWVKKVKEALQRLRAVMYAAWQFKPRTGLVHTAPDLHSLWKTTDPARGPRVFPMIMNGESAWKLGETHGLVASSTTTKPWMDWCTCTSAAFSTVEKKAFKGEFQPKWTRVNQLAYFKEFGKINGMSLQVESLSSANGTQAGIMAAMEARLASQNYVKTVGEWAFMKHSMPPLCRLLGKLLWQGTKSALAALNIHGYTVLGADLPMYYLYLQEDSGRLTGCFPDLVISGHNKLVSVEYKTRWLAGTMDYDQQTPSTIAAYVAMVGNRATVGTNHTQALAQGTMARLFFKQACHTLLQIAVVPGEQFVEHVGMYHTTVHPNATKEQQYQAAVLYQRWWLRLGRNAYADDVVWIESKSPAMLYAVQSQFAEVQLFFRSPTGTAVWNVALAGPHRTTRITKITTDQLKSIPAAQRRWRVFKLNSTGWYVCEPPGGRGGKTADSFVRTIAANSPYAGNFVDACDRDWAPASIKLRFLPHSVGHA